MDNSKLQIKQFLQKSGYIFMVFMIVFSTAQAESLTYYHNDLLGSPIATSDEAGNIKWEEQYKPYGERIIKNPASSTNEIWYTGKQHDEDTGLTYMNSRYSDPIFGRFMAIDPVPFSDKNPASFNRYVYANNNPYLYNDPGGELVSNIIGGLWAGLQNVAIQNLEIAVGSRDSFSVSEFATESALGVVTSGISTAKNIGKLGNLLSKSRKLEVCCFVAGTKVLTESGYKDIETVALGELVAAKNIEIGNR
ncbi:MAG: RHS repeat domain-containing protein [Thiohalomonadales bacterium]